jgi:hypothetical protein
VGDDIILEAVIGLHRQKRLPGTPAGMVVGGGESVRGQEELSVKRHIAPHTQHKDLFRKFARYIRVRPAQETLETVRAWVSEYGVLALPAWTIHNITASYGIQGEGRAFGAFGGRLVPQK